MEKSRYIGLCGPSGTGKTTLLNYMKEEKGIPCFSFSASVCFSDDSKEFLENEFGHKWQGHKDVIKRSIENPVFGFQFQKRLLLDRIKLVNKLKKLYPIFASDRTFIDNLVYFIHQSAPFQDNVVMDEFLKLSKKAISDNLSDIIFIPLNNPVGFVENNHSRVSSWYYQKVISKSFEFVIHEIVLPHLYEKRYKNIRVFTLDSWDLKIRKQNIDNILKLSNDESKENS